MATVYDFEVTADFTNDPFAAIAAERIAEYDAQFRPLDPRFEEPIGPIQPDAILYGPIRLRPEGAE